MNRYQNHYEIMPFTTHVHHSFVDAVHVGKFSEPAAGVSAERVTRSAR